MRDGAHRILLDRSAIERLDIAIHPALLPGQSAKNQDQQGGSNGGNSLPHTKPLARLRQQDNTGGQNSQARQILKMVSHIGIAERIDIQKSERRE